MNEQNYYSVKIKLEIETEKGIKHKKEGYIVRDVSPTAVEAKLAKHLQMSDYEIESITRMNVIEVVDIVD